MKKGVLLLNVGSTKAPTKKAVAHYLTEFLGDPKILGIKSNFCRKILVNGIIVPLRAKTSAKRYQLLWTEHGSPLTICLQNLQQKLEHALHTEYHVFAAVSYGEPNLCSVIKEIEQKHLDELMVLPLFPQYSLSTTENSIEKVKTLTANWNTTKINYIHYFYNQPSFIEAVVAQAENIEMCNFDHVLFSYHGVPISQFEAIRDKYCGEAYDYIKACNSTSNLIAQKLKLQKDDYSTAYQSRFSSKWIEPYSIEVIKQLAQDGKKNLLIFAPSFVADCLETTVEVGIEYKAIFREHGGQNLQLVPCLNDSEIWIQGLCKIIHSHLN